MATVYAILTFASDTIQKKSSLAEILPTIETIMSILQKEFFGGNVYSSTMKSERVQKKKIASTSCTMV